MEGRKGETSKAIGALEAIYGAPSQAGFGSAVFHDPLAPGEDLEPAARARYRYFVGDLWERYGEDAWLGPWQEVGARKAGDKHDIVAELQSIDDGDARQSVPMILDAVEDPDAGRAALAAVYDAPGMREVRAYRLGDGGAMSGLLVAGRDGDTGTATYLVFLLD